MRWLPTQGSARSRSQLVRRNNSKLIKPIVSSAPAVPPSLPTGGEGMGQARSGALFPGGALPSAWHSAPGPSCSCGPVHPHCHQRAGSRGSLCLSFLSCCQEKPLSAWLNQQHPILRTLVQMLWRKGMEELGRVGFFGAVGWGLGNLNAGGWRNTGGTCLAMLCYASPTGPLAAGDGDEDGDVGTCFAALWQPHGWSCQATAGWRRSGNKAGAAGTLVPPSLPKPCGQRGQ